jgi:hypothetical protein
MPNGKPGDHPLTDIFIHKLEVYGKEADELIRKIGELCSRRQLDEWWEKEIRWSDDHELVLQKARVRYQELLNQARERGWEARVGRNSLSVLRRMKGGGRFYNAFGAIRPAGLSPPAYLRYPSKTRNVT